MLETLDSPVQSHDAKASGKPRRRMPAWEFTLGCLRRQGYDVQGGRTRIRLRRRRRTLVEFHLCVRHRDRQVYVNVTGYRRADRSHTAQEHFKRMDTVLLAAQKEGIACILVEGHQREQLELDPRAGCRKINSLLDAQVRMLESRERQQAQQQRKERRLGSHRPRRDHRRSGRPFQPHPVFGSA